MKMFCLLCRVARSVAVVRRCVHSSVCGDEYCCLSMKGVALLWMVCRRFVGRWWRLFWVSRIVCFSVLARSGSGRSSPAWVSGGRVWLCPVLWGGSAAVMGGR